MLYKQHYKEAKAAAGIVGTIIMTGLDELSSSPVVLEAVADERISWRIGREGSQIKL